VLSGDKTAEPRDPERWERVVLPGSKGLMVRTNEEFHVLRIATTPAGLSYEGTPISMMGTGASVMPLLSDVAEIPGESLVGWYDLQTGEIESTPGSETVQLRETGTQPPPQVDPAWLRRVLAVYFEDAPLARLVERRGAVPSGGKPALVEALLSTWPALELLDTALEAYIAALAESGS
jgi:hypothetical protein